MFQGGDGKPVADAVELAKPVGAIWGARPHFMVFHAVLESWAHPRKSLQVLPLRDLRPSRRCSESHPLRQSKPAAGVSLLIN